MTPLPSGRQNIWLAIRFAAFHVAALLVFVVPFRPSLVIWFLASYLVRMFGVTAGYHRYFSHRSYKLGRVAQFVIAVLAQTAGQKGVLWWAAHHRDHHRHADLPEDVHSPRHGFWWSHVGWILSTERDVYDPVRVADFGRFPELRWLDRYHWTPLAALGVSMWMLGGLPLLAWGFLLPTVALYHATFAINSVAHIWGDRPFPTSDDSRNNFLLAVVTLGEGWHNNHHHCRSSCRQGVEWWQLDVTYLLLRALAYVGVARDLRPFVSRAERIAA